jgi:trans-aconitate methyltransferase
MALTPAALPEEDAVVAFNDRWNAQLYDQKHAFVSEYGDELLALLNPRANEVILDLGCGTGRLTKAIAGYGAQVVGIDNSPSMIAAARSGYPELEFVEANAKNFSFPYSFDAIFSNAALHWILDAESAVRCVSSCLKTDGRLVAEFGGKGNVMSIAQALRATLREHDRADESPWWYFPSIAEYAALLERHQMEVTFAVLFDRLTKLAEGEAGLRNWIEMFRGELFRDIGLELKGHILNRVEDRLRNNLFLDGSWYADYRRLRIVAVKV